jgi:hypothetical protein
MSIEVMKQALEALENTTPLGFNMEADKRHYAAITALRLAIEQAENDESPLIYVADVTMPDPGYECVVCGRFLPADEHGVIVHDDVPHPDDMTFDEKEKPQ